MLKLWSLIGVNGLQKFIQVHFTFFSCCTPAKAQLKVFPSFPQKTYAEDMCRTNEGRRLVSLLSALCDLRGMNWGWRPRVTSSGANMATESHSEHLPPLLQQLIHSTLVSLPAFLFSDLWPQFFFYPFKLCLLASLRSLFQLYHPYWFFFFFPLRLWSVAKGIPRTQWAS